MWSEAPELMTHLEAEDNRHVVELPVSANAAVGAVEFSVPKSRAYSSAEIVTVLSDAEATCADELLGYLAKSFLHVRLV